MKEHSRPCRLDGSLVTGTCTELKESRGEEILKCSILGGETLEKAR